MEALVSIIMPAYNAGAYVEAAIKSVLAQDYEYWELLIVNDGSTDDTADKIARFSDVRIRYFEQENGGVSAARNVALGAMRGVYCCFLDADDYWPAGSLSSRLKVFESDARVEFVDGVVEVRSHDLEAVQRVWTPSFRGNPHEALVRIDERCFLGLTWMFKVKTGRVYAMQEGLTHAEDLLFYIDLSQGGGAYAFTTETVLWYRDSPGSAMTNLGGLERGYMALYRTIEAKEYGTVAARSYLKKRLRRIMFRSYLRKIAPLKAIRAYLNFSKL